MCINYSIKNIFLGISEKKKPRTKHIFRIPVSIQLRNRCKLCKKCEYRVILYSFLIIMITLSYGYTFSLNRVHRFAFNSQFNTKMYRHLTFILYIYSL